MREFFAKFNRDSKKEQKQAPANTNSRQELIQKVEKGTDFAIREYKDVFRRLAEYDKK